MQILKTLLALSICLIFGGCTANNGNLKHASNFEEYEVVHVEGINTEIKNWFGHTIDVIENDYYIVTFLKNGNYERKELHLGEYGLHKLRTSENNKNYLRIEEHPFNTYVYLYLTPEAQRQWNVTY